MRNFTLPCQGSGKYLLAKVTGAINTIYPVLASKKQLRIVITGLLLLLLSSMGNHVFAITTTYYYPASVTAGGGGTYCAGSVATGLTGSVPTGGTTTGGSSTVTWKWYYNTTGVAGTLTGATLVYTGASYTATVATGSVPLPSADISTATPGVYYYFCYISYAGGAGTGTLFSNLVTVTVTSASPITGPGTVCIGSTITLTDSSPGSGWTSSAPSVATVSGGGMVTGVSAGTTTIEYTTTGCGIAATVVTVTGVPAAITGPDAVCMGETINLSDVSSSGTWSSSNTSVATVIPGTGVLSGITNGTTTISYSNGCGIAATETVTVNPLPAGITGSSTLCPDGAYIILNDATSGGMWTSTPATVATAVTSGANTGTITSGTMSGTATVTYTSPLGCITTTVVTVDPLPGPIEGVLHECVAVSTTLTDAVSGGVWSSSIPPVASIFAASGLLTGYSAGTVVVDYATGCGFVTAIDTVYPIPAIFATSGDSVCIGDTTSFAFLPAGGTWVSSVPSVATVLPGSGVITGISTGTSIIKYTANGCFATQTVAVNPLPSPIAGTMYVCPGASITLTDPTAGGVWSSGQSYVAGVNDTSGEVTGVSAGTATITYADGSACKVSAIVTVNPQPLPIVGGNTSCGATVDTLYDATSDGVWSSGTTSTAAITSVLFDTSVAVTTLAGGTATISYTLPTGCAATKSFKVNALPVPVVTYNWSTITFYTDTIYTSYQWYNTVQGAIAGATVYQTAAQYTADYWVVVTDTNGCTGASAQFPYNIAEAGIPTQTIAGLRIYPNPANGTVYIESGINVRAVISDVSGKTDMEQRDAKQLDISKLPGGVYFISLYADDGQRVMVEKLIKE